MHPMAKPRLGRAPRKGHAMSTAGLRHTAITAGGQVKRYHALFTLVPQTVAEHSYGVAWWCAILCDMAPSTNLLLAALLHDVAEAKVGDIPSPVKRELAISSAVEEMEEEYLAAYKLPMPELTEDETLVLRIADCLDGIAFCRRELALGNARLGTTLDNYVRYVRELQLPQWLAAVTHTALSHLLY